MAESSIKAILTRSIAQQMSLAEKAVDAVLTLIDEGCTIPFIARYRKEASGGMSDETLRQFEECLGQVKALEERRESIRKSLEKSGVLTPKLEETLRGLQSKQALEDFYLPYKPSRHTKAAKAKAKGLEPLAQTLLDPNEFRHPNQIVKGFVNPAKGVKDAKEAIAGAIDILVEDLANRADLRAKIRGRRQRGFLTVKATRGKKDEAAQSVYRDLVGLRSKVEYLKGHRILAIDRGEREGLLSVKVEGQEKWELEDLERRWIPRSRGRRPAEEVLRQAVKQALTDRIGPACEKDVRKELSEEAQLSALENFRSNLRALLLGPPLKRQVILGVDPGFRTGCKLAVVDAHGKYLESATMYPHSGKEEPARRILKTLLDRHKVTVIAIGNGTASRETARFVSSFLKGYKSEQKISQVIVNESGASVYSASKLASQEHPDLDVTVRGTLSIARRVLDPLAELVKIDPKSLGVGQYQHDIDAKRLDKALSGIVEQVVNEVGVDLNRASGALLRYVSGIGPKLAETIVKRREKKPFQSRKELLKVAGLGPRAYLQAAGFLRVPESKEVLDHTAVHPESYDVARRIAKALGSPVSDLIGNKAVLDKVNVKQFVEGKVGPETIEDILDELAQPGRDPRGEAQSMEYTEGVETIDDLTVGLKLKGTVTNVTDFGAFVDIGVHRDGLIHISKFGRRIGHPSDVVHVRQQIDVTIENVDKERGRISLKYG